ncbi:hypothetical protein GobsT_22400 [Gemmata obscuriglobus]|nr:hypothetical protein GobsT_22400 [Gemmata obscuriglobus]VTS04487.1 unnamed protein product [Gemmata obscuriglobus UQM 2246]
MTQPVRNNRANEHPKHTKTENECHYPGGRGSSTKRHRGWVHVSGAGATIAPPLLRDITRAIARYKIYVKSCGMPRVQFCPDRYPATFEGTPQRPMFPNRGGSRDSKNDVVRISPHFREEMRSLPRSRIAVRPDRSLVHLKRLKSAGRRRKLLYKLCKNVILDYAAAAIVGQRRNRDWSERSQSFQVRTSDRCVSSDCGPLTPRAVHRRLGCACRTTTERMTPTPGAVRLREATAHGRSGPHPRPEPRANLKRLDSPDAARSGDAPGAIWHAKCHRFRRSRSAQLPPRANDVPVARCVRRFLRRG